ncbi:hypothetical protein [Demequina lutea]|uniref:Uncharacterized protein n=1 Tax=Demequina lutea TaxID=431489 RepID=A0A7Z0CH54_9MICO|nr:hypothetical protein [Demequina lutea]NYI40484.1 hypothetical protein [Demequina lutea]
MNVVAILTGVVPSLGVLGIFVYVMRGITRGDRHEREAIAAYDREQAAAAAKPTEAHRESDLNDSVG